ncbi:MAG: tRNA(His) guanylyltransferase Thg1 family protein [Pyrobaculum sp.]|uniref:tRNA(His) guanylyltransferase Thg1 family protein n=1 Tax=Pyrobaculum sp. TaxID=2004705 RepID=UPI003165EBED
MDSLRRLLAENPRVLEMRYREREVVCEPASPPFAVRLDGVGFGSRLRDFPHPRSRLVHNALVEVARALAQTYGADFVHVVSDEINLFFHRLAPYGGRTFKIISVLAGHASAEATALLGRPLYFDGRVVKLRDLCDAATYFLFRARVGLNNYAVQIARGMGLLRERTPPIGEVVAKIKIDDYELAWGAFLEKERGYRKEVDVCNALSSLCNVC